MHARQQQTNQSRKLNSAKNFATSWFSQACFVILRFAVRIVFVKTLGEEYLGISGLFVNILVMLQLADLGIGAAIGYSLYKPIAEHDIKKIKALMGFFRKVYITIGCVIMVLGSALTPFLHVFIKKMPDIPNLQIIYLLFVLGTAETYFYSYKSTLLYADQKNYILTTVNLIVTFILNALQIVILYATRNYILYVCAQILITFIQNVIISKIADKRYPYLREKQKEKLDNQSIRGILKYTGTMSLNKIGGVIVYSSDTMVISKFVGIIENGFYSNYVLITTAVSGVVNQAFSAIAASVGNLGVTESRKRKKEIFDITFLINFLIYSFCSISILNLSNPFVQLCFGKKYVLDFSVVLIISVNFYVTGMRQAVDTFNTAFGLLWHNRYRPIAESLINLGLSIVLVQYMGIFGVLLATLISVLTTGLWVDPYVLYKYGFEISVKQYFFRYAVYAAVTGASGLLTWWLCSLVQLSLVPLIAVRLFICLVVPNTINLLVFCRSKDFMFVKNYLLSTRVIMKKWIARRLPKK